MPDEDTAWQLKQICEDVAEHKKALLSHIGQEEQVIDEIKFGLSNVQADVVEIKGEINLLREDLSPVISFLHDAPAVGRMRDRIVFAAWWTAKTSAAIVFVGGLWMSILTFLQHGKITLKHLLDFFK